MNVYLILAHPEIKSFNGELKEVAIATLTAAGHEVKSLDLFQSGFKTTADSADFPDFDTDFFDLQAAQATLNYPADITAEHEKLLWADVLLFQFPIWWESMPAPLKGYIDRVFTVGFAYNGRKALAGKKAVVCCTAGAPNSVWTKGNRGDLVDEILHHLFHGTFDFCEMEVLPPYLIGAAKRLSAAEKAAAIEGYIKFIQNICPVD